MIQEKSASEKINNALVILLQEKSFNKITVTDIINKAQVNRSTYYYHYYKTEEVLEEIINTSISDLVKKMEESIQDPAKYKIDDTPLPTTIVMFQHIYDFREYYTSLMQSDVSYQFTRKFVQAIINFNKKLQVKFTNESSEDSIDWEMYINYKTFAALGQVQYWMNSNFVYSPEYMAEQMTNFRFMRMESINISK